MVEGGRGPSLALGISARGSDAAEGASSSNPAALTSDLRRQAMIPRPYAEVNSDKPWQQLPPAHKKSAESDTGWSAR